MAKIIKLLCILFCIVLTGTFALVNVNAEETEQEEPVEPEYVEEVFTYYEGERVYTYIIFNEQQARCIITMGENDSTELLMTYIYENEILTFYMLGEQLGSFTIGENNILELYEEPVIDEPVIEFPCSVSLSEVKNGTITFSKTEGEIGEIIEVYNTPALLYDLIEITANGVVLTPDEYGVYSFILVEGENIVTAKFEVSDEKLQQVADLLNKAKEGNWEEIFTVSNLMQLISWLITLGCSSGFFVTLYKSKKFKELTPQEIARKVDEKINSVLDERLATFLKDVFGPFTENMLQKFSGMENSTKTMVRCFILMQENTPESRLAILNELNNLNNNETGQLTLQVKNLIAEEVRKQEEQSKALNETIENLKTETSTNVTHL